MIKSGARAATVVFSKNRALQLDAALRSFDAACQDLDQFKTVVLYSATTKIDVRQYDQLISQYETIEFVRQERFRDDLIAILDNINYVLFLVDDNFFTISWNFKPLASTLEDNENILGVSLRLGYNTTWCYSLNIPQPLPETTPLNEDIVVFEYNKGIGDFGYPLEVSSSIYRAADIKAILSDFAFNNPNQLEAALQTRSSAVREKRPLLAMFKTSVAFCNPINVVQVEFVNRHGLSVRWNNEQLRALFDAGARIDIAPYWGLVAGSCHEEQPLRFIHPEPRLVAGKMEFSFERRLPDDLSAVAAGRLHTDNWLERLHGLTGPGVIERLRNDSEETFDLFRSEMNEKEILITRLHDDLTKQRNKFNLMLAIASSELSERRDHEARLTYDLEQWQHFVGPFKRLFLLFFGVARRVARVRRRIVQRLLRWLDRLDRPVSEVAAIASDVAEPVSRSIAAQTWPTSLKTDGGTLTGPDAARLLASASAEFGLIVRGQHPLEATAVERLVLALRTHPYKRLASGSVLEGGKIVAQAVLFRRRRGLGGRIPRIGPTGEILLGRWSSLGVPRIFAHPDAPAPASDEFRPTVLAIVPYLPVGGAETVLHQIVSALARDYEFIIVTTLPATHEWHDRFIELAPRIFHLPDFIPERSWDEFLLNLLQREKISRVLTAGSAYGYEVLPRIKVALPQVCTYAILHNDEWRGHRANALRVISSIDQLVAISERIAATLFYLDGVPRERISLIPNGVEINHRFSPDAVPKQAAKDRFNIPRESFVIGFVGRLSPEKGPLAFLDLIDRIDVGQNVAFAIFGEGPLEDAVTQRLSKLNDGAIVRWTRRVKPDDMPSAYAALDLLVITSNSEGLPFSLVEAMAMEVPAVAYAVGDIAALLPDGETGQLVPPGDFVALVSHVRHLAANPALCRRMGKAARARLIELGLTEERMAAGYRDLFADEETRAAARP
jgi:glycosyltransferase involved in cell wall biosynthesis